MNLITLDFETYYADDYSLSKMTTEEYVRDPRFHAQMIGIKVSAGGTKVVTPEVLRHPRVREAVETSAVVCHHAHFDGLILAHHYGLRPKFWIDTLSMARMVLPHARSHSLDKLSEHFGLPRKQYDKLADVKNVRDLSPSQFNSLGEMCSGDVDNTHAIALKLLKGFPREELELIDLTVRMFTEPVLELDRPRLQRHLEAVRRRKEILLGEAGVSRGDMASAAKFSALLERLGVEVPMKPNSKGEMIPALAKTDDGMKALLEHEDLTVQTLAAARLGVKSTLEETRSERMLGMAERGPMPVYLNYAGAHTLRWSGGDKMNWQNFTRGGEIRQSVLAPEDCVLVVGDLSNIECRMLCWLAGEEDALQAFRDGRDLYCEQASITYGRVITKVDRIERHLGKTLVLGAGFGMGPPKFQITCRRGALGGPSINLSLDESKRAIYSYRDSHPNVVRYWSQADQVLDALFHKKEMTWGPMQIRDGRIYGSGGSWLDYTNLKRGDDGEYYTEGRRGKAKIYGAKLVENVVQWLSRIILGQAMLRLRSYGYKIVLSTHDETCITCLEKDAEIVYATTIRELIRVPSWAKGIPLSAEGGFTREYSK